ncbi:protein canopy homolog 4 isoform X2 [Lissotriton helveticus]
MKGEWPLVLALLCLFWDRSQGAKEEEQERLPNKCEVCKFLTVELQSVLEKSSRSKEVLEMGQILDSGSRKKRIKYNTSETRLAEALDNICERILEYSVHAERHGSLRYAKCETMLEEFEEVVEDWYFHHQGEGLQAFLCETHVLRPNDRECLKEVWTGKKGDPGHAPDEKADDEDQSMDALPSDKPGPDPSVDTSQWEGGRYPGEL